MSSKNHQVAGEHYKKRAIQPIEYIIANELPFCEGNIIKYVTRHRDKGGREDIEKLIQYAQFLLEEYDRDIPTHSPEVDIALKRARMDLLKDGLAQVGDPLPVVFVGDVDVKTYTLPRVEAYVGQRLDNIYYDPITKKYYSK